MREGIIKKITEATFRLLNQPKYLSCCVNSVTKSEIQSLNKEFRGIDKPTDVLSFPNLDIKAGEVADKGKFKFDYDMEAKELNLGDVYICEDIAAVQAKEYGHSFERETAYLCVHGILHLLGYDHENDADKKIMRETEEKIMSEVNPDFKSGFVAVLGRPNVGKSSIVNMLTGEKVSIVSNKPQTTRHKIIGIVNGENYQIVLVDTPGIIKPKNKLNEAMMKSVENGEKDVDVLMLVLDAQKGLTENDIELINRYKRNNLIIVLNKMDLINYEKAFPILDKLNKIEDIHAIVPISAKTGKNKDELLKLILSKMTDNIAYFERDEYTDRSERFMISEIIREKILHRTSEEIPHGVFIEIIEIKQQKNFVKVSADVIVEREGHKQIIIGSKADKIKKIGTLARADIEKLLDKKVMLTLFVKVKEGWRDKKAIVSEYGF